MPLQRFGFTRTQDAVYKALLRLEAATGYAVARETGLARANVYQALDALVSRDLARSSGGRPATYRAVEASAAVAVLAKRADEELKALAAELGVPHRASAETRDGAAPGVEALGGRVALFAAAVESADAAAHEILAVVGPWAPTVIAALSRARLRGVSWKVVSLGAPVPEGAALRTVPPAELTAYWGGMPIALVCDRSLAVCGIVSGDQADGIRTASRGLVPFLRHLLRRELAAVASPRIS
ncbi:MAG: helix-turn-helix domain-containing protein [Gemmatimonadales bacterium]|jgi:sugar-specific transcriptional regulator TrmB